MNTYQHVVLMFQASIHSILLLLLKRNVNINILFILLLHALYKTHVHLDNLYNSNYYNLNTHIFLSNYKLFISLIVH